MRALVVGVGLALSVSSIASAAESEVDAMLKTLAINPKSAAEVNSRCDAYAAKAADLRVKLEAGKGAATVESVFLPYDDLYNLTVTANAESSLVMESHPSKEVRAAAETCAQRMADLSTSIGLSRPIYDRLAAIDPATVPASMRYAMDRRLSSYRRAGVDRDAETRAKVEALNKAITATGLEFGRNIREDKDEITVASAAELAGLPQDYIDAHKPGPDGLIHITTDYPDVFPILDFADNADVRKRMLVAFNSRAYPANEAVLARLLQQRHELAQLLGYPSYAHLIIEDKMMGTPEKAAEFIEGMKTVADPGATRDYAILLERLRKIEPGATEVPRWSSAYLARLVRKEQYDVDAAEVRKYFPYETTRAGVLDLMEDMFQVQIRPWAGAPVWHESVSAHELYDGDKLIGRFFLDMHPREGKFNHAAMFPIRVGVQDRAVPVAALLTNFPSGMEAMDHEDVATFVHEFGHLMHWLFSGRQPLAQQNFSETEWDFVEAPSQLLEEWVWDYDVLKRFAKDKDGNPIPEDLVRKMNAGRMFNEPTGALGQLMLSSVSLNLYNRSPQGLDAESVFRSEYERFMPYSFVEGTHPHTAIGHLDGYSATYYTYVWSKAIGLDLFSRFKAAGLLDQATARQYRDTVLAPGGSASATTFVSNFLGRPLSLQAYRDYLSGTVATAP